MTETLRRGFPGMKSVKDMPVMQDGPPPGGFPSVRYARRIPSTGPTGFTIFAVSTVVMAYGFYRVGQGNAERREFREAKRAARRALVPVLQAEEDRRWLNASKFARKAEEVLMKDVEGWKMHADVYNTRWMPPARPVGE
ncbi:hypothetical protein BSKO_13709 [Bryopsis sp. KO-2023]|nr:hypothetical protein BSKO_13709 [Bryopsis sp. KO-2023]